MMCFVHAHSMLIWFKTEIIWSLSFFKQFLLVNWSRKKNYNRHYVAFLETYMAVTLSDFFCLFVTNNFLFNQSLKEYRFIYKVLTDIAKRRKIMKPFTFYYSRLILYLFADILKVHYIGVKVMHGKVYIFLFWFSL